MEVAYAQSPEQPESVSQSTYQTDFDALYERWTPAYQQAIYDLVKFEERFYVAVSLTDAYLGEQSALTATIRDPELRADQDRFDREEREAVKRWVANGDALLSQMAIIRTDLEDMNIVITKQQLRVEFLSENAALYQIPESARQLHDSLGSFKTESDSLAQRLQAEAFSR